MAIVTESYFYPVAAQLGAFTRFSKQVLLFEINGFKNCKIESEVVNISVGHSVIECNFD